MAVSSKFARAQLAPVGAREAYSAVAQRLRDMILRGELAPGEQLPREAELCEVFGVSRSTVREAIRSLNSEHLVDIVRGAGGGTFVSRPKIADMTDSLAAMFGLIAGSDQCTIDELVEARKLLEINAARMAATSKTDEQLAALRSTLPSPASRSRLSARKVWDSNYGFHVALLEAAGNRVVQALAMPVFTTLHYRVRRESKGFPSDRVISEHWEMIEAVEAGDPERAASLMTDHLEGLKPVYSQLEYSP